MNIVTSCLMTVTVWLFMVGRARYRQLSPYIRALFAIALICVAAKGIWRVVMMAASNTRHPPDWDFQIFWIDGVMAARGLNFYDSALATQLAAPFHPSLGFAQAALAAPFLYPPPSIFWFVPLGWMDIHKAALVWYIIQFACLIGSILVLSLTFLKTLSAINIAFTTALLLMVHATFWNVADAQTVFLLLLFVSLAFRHRNKPWGGAWLALAILVKPFVVVVLLYPLLRRNWRSLAASTATLLAATIATFIIFGPKVFASYAAIPFQALPMSMYTEIDNQSLLAWILRITHSATRLPPGYVILAGLSGILLLWRLVTTGKGSGAAGFTLILTFGLLLYPASLRSYTVLLILPILVLYNARLWVVVALAYGFMYLAQGDYVVLSTLAVAIALAVRMPALSAEAET